MNMDGQNKQDGMTNQKTERLIDCCVEKMRFPATADPLDRHTPS
jgi:hypothetical protein